MAQFALSLDSGLDQGNSAKDCCCYCQEPSSTHPHVYMPRSPHSSVPLLPARPVAPARAAARPRLTHLLLFGDSLCAERGNLNRRQRFVVVDSTTRQKQKLKNKPPSSEVDNRPRNPKPSLAKLPVLEAAGTQPRGGAGQTGLGRRAASPSKPRVPLRPGLSERPHVLVPVQEGQAHPPWRWAPGQGLTSKPVSGVPHWSFTLSRNPCSRGPPHLHPRLSPTNLLDPSSHREAGAA